MRARILAAALLASCAIEGCCTGLGGATPPGITHAEPRATFGRQKKKWPGRRTPAGTAVEAQTVPMEGVPGGRAIVINPTPTPAASASPSPTP